MYEDHVDSVTVRVRQWLEGEHRNVIDTKLREIAEANSDAGNDPGVGFDEDVESLAGALEDYTVKTLVDPLTGIVGDFVRDCVSEADWTEIALAYIEHDEEVKNGLQGTVRETREGG